MEELNLYSEEERLCGMKNHLSTAEVGEEIAENEEGYGSLTVNGSPDEESCSWTPFIEIDRDTYCEVASALIDAVGDGYYYNGTIDGDGNGFYYTLTATVIVYREDRYASEGHSSCVRDLVPVWWEFATVVPQAGEVLNDFSFGDLKEAVISAL